MDSEYIYEQCQEALDGHVRDLGQDIQEILDMIRMALSEEYGVAIHRLTDEQVSENGPARSECPECHEMVFAMWNDLPQILPCPFCTLMYYAIKEEDVELDVEVELEDSGADPVPGTYWRWESDIPNPGTLAAQSDGCICPVLDNEHGAGAYTDKYGVTQFWITDGCPIHCIPQDVAAAS